MTDRTTIQLPPGLRRTGSEAEMAGHWYDGNLVRWVGGVLRPMDGWEKMALTEGGTPFVPDSPIRKLHTWLTSAQQKYTAILCETHLYVMDTAGVVVDITPTGGIAGTGALTEGGYGEATYSYDTYGTPRPDRPPPRTVGPMWSVDNWGDDLLAMASTDSKLLRWKPSDPPGTLAAEIAATTGTVPRGRFFIVTAERHVMVFQDQDFFNRFSWCSQEDVEDWDYADLTNSAGFYDIQPANPFIAATVTRSAILAFTSRGAYALIYTGTPYFYTYNFLGNYNAPVTGEAIAQVSTGAIWLSDDGFWSFDGSTIAPLACTLLDFLKQSSDPVYLYISTHAFYLGAQSEAWFFWPLKEGDGRANRFFAYNFDEKWWTMGVLDRTCGFPGSVMTYPLMSDGTAIYQHEKGNFFAEAVVLPYAQSGAVNVANGARLATVRQGIADTRAPAQDVQFYVGGRRDRIEDGSEVPDTEMHLAVRREGGKVDFRVTGRDIVLRIQAARNGVKPWTFGQMLVKVFPRGGR